MNESDIVPTQPIKACGSCLDRPRYVRFRHIPSFTRRFRNDLIWSPADPVIWPLKRQFARLRISAPAVSECPTDQAVS